MDKSYRKHFLIFSLLILFSINKVFSQNNKEVNYLKLIDSITFSMDTIQNDSLYLSSFFKVVKYYIQLNNDSTLTYINKGIEEAKKRDNKRFQAQFFNQKGVYYRYRKELDSSLYYYQLSGNTLLEINDSSSYIGLTINIANVYKIQGDYEKSINLFIDAINYYERFPDSMHQQKVLIGKLNLAGIYTAFKEYDKSVEILLKVANHPLAKMNKIIYSTACINLAGLLTKSDRLEEALFYSKEAEKIVTKKRSLANLYMNTGTIYEKKKEYLSSISYYEKSLKIHLQSKNSSGITSVYNNLGNVNTKMKNYNQAEAYLLKSKELILEGGADLKSIRHNYEMLVTVNEGQKDYKDAYKYGKELKKIQDSILGLEMRKALLDVETKYQTNEIIKEKKLAEANEKIAQQATILSNRQLLFSVIFLIIVLGLLFYIFSRLKLIRKKNKQLDEAYLLLEESKKYELAASNLKALKSQMNPHFIFNSLNSIQDLIIKNEKETSYDYIVLFAELVRSSLNNSNNDFIPIEEELEFLEVYLKLEKLRFGKEFNYKIIANEVDDIYIPSLIIQPFLENALLHGLMHKKGEKNLTIEFKLNNELVCIITDNGVGREEAKRIKERRGVAHESFAMKAIEERLNLLSERFGTTYKFKVEDLKENNIPFGTKIILSIPFKEEYYQD